VVQTLAPFQQMQYELPMSGGQKQFAILAGIVAALILAARFIGVRKPLEGGELGAVAVFVAIAALGVFLDK
jgi:hypothetical protein